METKTCRCCKETRLLTDYYEHRGVCKFCRLKRQKELYLLMTPEQLKVKRQREKVYNINNRDRANELARENNKKPQAKAWRKEYRQKNKVALREQDRKHKENYMRKSGKREAALARGQRNRDELNLGYVKKMLFRKPTSDEIPVELLKAKRIQVQIQRAIKNMTPA